MPVHTVGFMKNGSLSVHSLNEHYLYIPQYIYSFFESLLMKNLSLSTKEAERTVFRKLTVTEGTLSVNPRCIYNIQMYIRFPFACLQASLLVPHVQGL